MYKGKDRTKQVEALKTLASDIVTHSGIESPAEARFVVSEWVDESDEPMPEWYDEHDRRLLLEWVATEVLGDRLYLQPTGYVYFVELDKGTEISEPSGVEVVVLTPEQTVAVRHTTHSTNAPWELVVIEDAAGYILDAQQAMRKYDR